MNRRFYCITAAALAVAAMLMLLWGFESSKKATPAPVDEPTSSGRIIENPDGPELQKIKQMVKAV